MHLEKRASRLYFVDAPFAAKDAIKALGAHWDGDQRLWWIGSTKAEAAQKLVDSLPGKLRERDDKAQEREGLNTEVKGKAIYKGKTYYYTWEGRTKAGKDAAKLVSLDGKLAFWADCGNAPDQCRIIKSYANARTIQSLRDYAEKARNANPDDPSTWTREQKREYLDGLDQCDEFAEAERLARQWGIRDY